MDREGNLVFALDTVYSLTYSGKLRWKVGLDGFADAPLVSDALGNVYAIRWRTTQGAEEVLCFSKDGGIVWRVPFPLVEWNGESPALTKNGILLTASYKGTKLSAIR